MYGILGTFSAAKTNESLSGFEIFKSGFFTGILEVDEKGNFTGELEDCYGKSKIQGFLDEKEISFEKSYVKSDGQIGDTFKYTLLRRTTMEAWSGTWKFTGSNPLNERHEGIGF